MKIAMIGRASMVAAIVAAAGSMLAAHAAQEKQFTSEDIKQVSATVEAVDQAKRTVVLVGPDGARRLVAVGPDVRNFAQIKPGDRVVASYYEAIAAEVKPKGKGVQGVEKTGGTARAPEGQRPAAAAVSSIATTVRIESVDTSFDTVTFKRADGIVRTVAVEDPEAVKFIAKLRPGDEVEITYTEAVAINLEPAQR